VGAFTMSDSGCGFTHPSIPSRLRAGEFLRVGSSREGKQVPAGCKKLLNSYTFFSESDDVVPAKISHQAETKGPCLQEVPDGQIAVCFMFARQLLQAKSNLQLIETCFRP